MRTTEAYNEVQALALARSLTRKQLESNPRSSIYRRAIEIQIDKDWS